MDKAHLKEAFRNSGLLKKPKHSFYPDIYGGECAPWCEACKIEDELAPPCVKCGKPWNGRHCDHD